MIKNRNDYCVIENMDFEDFLKKYESRLANRIDLFIPDPPYNILKKNHDRISEIQMKNLCLYAQHYLAPTGTVIIFCSAKQISIYQHYLKEARLVVDDNVLNLIKDPKSYLFINFKILILN